MFFGRKEPDQAEQPRTDTSLFAAILGFWPRTPFAHQEEEETPEEDSSLQQWLRKILHDELDEYVDKKLSKAQLGNEIDEIVARAVSRERQRHVNERQARESQRRRRTEQRRKLRKKKEKREKIAVAIGSAAAGAVFQALSRTWLG